MLEGLKAAFLEEKEAKEGKTGGGKKDAGKNGKKATEKSAHFYAMETVIR